MGLRNARPKLDCLGASVFSFCSSAASACFSASVSQRADWGRSGSQASTAKPASTEGMPSSKKSHCQFRNGATPSMPLMINPASGPPTTPAMANEVMKSPLILPRRCAGTQYVRYSITPGKNPASNAPSRKRST
ncbi:hypothetical protein D3C72_1686850 [compost metagenome]